MPTRLQIAKPDIVAFLDEQKVRVYRQKDLATILREHRRAWRLAQRTTVNEFLEFLCKKAHLERVVLGSGEYPALKRFTWRSASPYEIGVSIRKSAYLSHGTAVFLHGLTDQVPVTIHVNAEQSPKRAAEGELTQERITRAFKAPQRRSKYIFTHGSHRYRVLSGKNTGRLGVIRLSLPEGGCIDVAGLERTLIDIAVRPEYGGGVHHVLAAYEGARNIASVNTIVALLKKLDYRYPYHQAIGFYLSRAGFPAHRIERLRGPGLEFDFYLAHGMDEVEYDADWRLWHPKGM